MEQIAWIKSKLDENERGAAEVSGWTPPGVQSTNCRVASLETGYPRHKDDTLGSLVRRRVWAETRLLAALLSFPEK